VSGDWACVEDVAHQRVALACRIFRPAAGTSKVAAVVLFWAAVQAIRQYTLNTVRSPSGLCSGTSRVPNTEAWAANAVPAWSAERGTDAHPRG
jgi:hypothetical protein